MCWMDLTHPESCSSGFSCLPLVCVVLLRLSVPDALSGLSCLCLMHCLVSVVSICVCPVSVFFWGFCLICSHLIPIYDCQFLVVSSQSRVLFEAILFWFMCQFSAVSVTCICLFGVVSIWNVLVWLLNLISLVSVITRLFWWSWSNTAQNTRSPVWGWKWRTGQWKPCCAGG